MLTIMPFHVQEIITNTLTWVDSLGSVGAIAFIIIYILATIALIPASFLSLGAGVVFGVVFGSLYVLVGSILGAVAAFLIGRYFARDWIAKKIKGNSKFRAIDEAVGKEGFKIVTLTRLSPIFPFILLNYLYSITGVSLKDYILGSVGMIPGIITFVYIGSLGESIATLGTGTQTTNQALEWTLRIIGLMATVAVTVYVTKIARRALEKEVF
jgi:uncharacterized membrane protein YdjX (TVP38/TMEM64 family)